VGKSLGSTTGMVFTRPIKINNGFKSDGIIGRPAKKWGWLQAQTSVSLEK
jgi:hypothetical protein